jgi:hypothetical protein
VKAQTTKGWEKPKQSRDRDGGSIVSNEDQLSLFPDSDNEEVVPELPRNPNSKAARNYVNAVPRSEVLEVFDYWRQKLHHSSAHAVKLTEKRYARIAAAISIYGVQTCMLAIKGCTMSSWHMGENPQGLRYTDVALIFRSHDHVNKFVALATGETDAARAFLEEDTIEDDE